MPLRRFVVASFLPTKKFKKSYNRQHLQSLQSILWYGTKTRTAFTWTGGLTNISKTYSAREAMTSPRLGFMRDNAPRPPVAADGLLIIIA
jgi:hypothetical protein